ncbi:hypothetical protein ACAG96_01160 [Candidatus Izemoplasma sp. B36]|uniref:hypothetical protein n=1 Tax=Candidatus Izemoplasma sp. B36 TaxID=3242468 RepID=UPI003555C3B0
MNNTYRELMHKYGRIFGVLGLLVMFLAPTMMWIVTGVSPNWAQLGAGVVALSVIYLPGGLIEMMTYSPLLGTSATYLAFVTGNLINLKVPCVMNATEICGTKIGTQENEVVSTISVAFSSITTVIILSLGILLLIPLRPLLESPVLAPAFTWVISALFGALGYKYFKGNWKLVIAPIVVVIIFSIVMPTFVNGQVIIMILICAIATLVVSKVLFDKKII